MEQNSKVIVNGDITQCDLENKTHNGLIDLLERVDVDSPMVECVEFSIDEVRRSEFVKYVLSLY